MHTALVGTRRRRVRESSDGPAGRPYLSCLVRTRNPVAQILVPDPEATLR